MKDARRWIRMWIWRVLQSRIDFKMSAAGVEIPAHH